MSNQPMCQSIRETREQLRDVTTVHPILYITQVSPSLVKSIHPSHTLPESHLRYQYTYRPILCSLSHQYNVSSIPWSSHTNIHTPKYKQKCKSSVEKLHIYIHRTYIHAFGCRLIEYNYCSSDSWWNCMGNLKMSHPKYCTCRIQLITKYYRPTQLYRLPHFIQTLVYNDSSCFIIDTERK